MGKREKNRKIGLYERRRRWGEGEEREMTKRTRRIKKPKEWEYEDEGEKRNVFKRRKHVRKRNMHVTYTLLSHGMMFLMSQSLFLPRL